jgi:hypothetical protein
MRFLKLLAVGVAGVVTAILVVSLGSASAEAYTITVPRGERRGVCSNGAVTGLSYTVVATPPGLYNVLTVTKPAYDVLLTADFNQPGLPSPLLEMSIFSPPRIILGSRTLPANRKLKAQVICLLFDNVAPPGAPSLLELPVVVTVNVHFDYIPPPPPNTGTTAGEAVPGSQNLRWRSSASSGPAGIVTSGTKSRGQENATRNVAVSRA